MRSREEQVAKEYQEVHEFKRQSEGGGFIEPNTPPPPIEQYENTVYVDMSVDYIEDESKEAKR